MIIGLWHPGSGVGDQLFCYLAARITAERLGVDFGMIGEFKGDSFMKLKVHKINTVPFITEMPAGKIVVQSGFSLFEGKRWYDPEFNFIEDNTIIDGCMMQDPRYFDRRFSRIRRWLAVEPLSTSDDLCVIGFRGGEYAAVPELFLPESYWNEAIKIMRRANQNMRFEVHTDDPVRAKQFFPAYPVIHDVGINWRSVRYAKYLIIANSAFYILPSLLNEDVKKVVAPRYWARRNIKEWSLPQNYYRQFTYV